VVIVGTYRDSTLDSNPALVRTLEELLRLGLRPLKLADLSYEAVGQMLQSLSRREPSQHLVHVIFTETHGNPFLVEELYRHLVAEGKVVEETGALRSDVSVAELGVPDTVRLVLERRLKRLGEEARSVLTAAVAIAPYFGFKLLQTLQDRTALDDLLLALDQVQRMGLFVSTTDSPREEVSLGGSVALELVSHDHARDGGQAFEPRAEEHLGRLPIPAALHPDIQYVPLLIYCLP